MSNVTSYHVTGDWRHIVEDGMVDQDPLPDEVLPTGHVTFTPITPRVAVAGVPATAYTLGPDKALIAQGVLTDMQGRPGIWLAGEIGGTTVRWQADVHIEFREQKIDYPSVTFDLTEDVRLSGIIQQAGRLTPIVIDPRIEALAARLADVDQVVDDAEQIVSDAAQSVVDAKAHADRAEGLAVAQDEHVAGVLEDPESLTHAAFKAVGNATYDIIGRPERMNAQPYEFQSDRNNKVLWQDGNTLYGARSGGLITKSTNGGVSWTDTGGAVPNIDAILVLSTGTLLATSNSTAKMYRSTDDGATWTHIRDITERVLGHQGMLECPDGSILQADYGLNDSTTYRLWRSTDDGLTWTVVFTPDPQPSATQIHCVVWDHIEQCVILMVDDMVPEHWRSDDYGQTWTLIGKSTEQIHPNWVAPMFFDNYIAWGYDSEMGGRIARISRTDFYAGNWNADTIEQIAHVNGKAWYWTYPVRPDVWIVALADEVISPGWGDGQGNPREYGSWAQEVYIVWGDGGKVNGGVSWTDPLSAVGTLSGSKIGFPGYPREFGDQRGLCWIYFRPGDGVSFTSVPVSFGWGDPLARISSATHSVTRPQFKNGIELPFLTPEGNYAGAIGIHSSNRFYMTNRASSALPEFRQMGNSAGAQMFLFNGATAAEFRSAGLIMAAAASIYMGGLSSPSIRSSASNPEGNTGGAPGSICLAADGGVYLKVSGTGVTGWKRLATMDDVTPA